MKFKEISSLLAKQEGLKTQVSIGNVRELLRLTLALLASLPAGEVGALLVKYRNKKIKI